MVTQWVCPKGHHTESTDMPSACPECGNTLRRSANTPHPEATVDLPMRPEAELPGTLPATPSRTATVVPSTQPFAACNIHVPGYEILDELGRGGMGVVYKARQTGLNRLVALKMILAAEHAGPAERMRFQTEAQAVAQIHHPNIVQIYEVGETEGRPYFSLEYVDGGSLAQKLTGHPQPGRAAAALIESLARAVAVAHEAGIIHRDLKPANVLLVTPHSTAEAIKSLSSLSLLAAHPYGIPKVTDFGLAKRLEGGSGQTQSGSIMGTPSYMAPEQAAGKTKEIGPHTDVYALGAILYEMLTGRPPFLGETPFETIMQVLRDEPVAPHQLQPKAPRDLEIICLKCLEKNPAKRYRSAVEFADELVRFLDGEPISARAATHWEKARKWTRRHPAIAAFMVLGFATLTAIGVGAYIYHQKLQAALDDSQMQRRLDLIRNIRLTVNNGTQDLNKGDLLRALPSFAEALRLEDGVAEKEEMHRIRLAAVFRQCPRLTRAWFHEGRVNDGAFSPDGRFVLTACEDGYARVFAIDQLDGEEPLLKLQHPAGVLQARFGPKGRQIVTVCNDHAARLWNAQSGAMIAQPIRHEGTITSVSFDKDGNRVLTTSSDRTARIWDTPTGEASPVVLKHNGSITHGEFGADGLRIATASADGTARVWDADTGKPISPILAHAGPVVCVRFSPDGKRVLTASQDQTARVWDALSGVALSPPIQVSMPLTNAAFSPNNRDVATASSVGAARVWDTWINEWKTYVVKHESPIVDIRFSPDGRMMATGGNDNTARVWEVSRGEPVTPPLRHNGTVYRVVFSAAGSQLLTSSQDGLVRLWDIAAGRVQAHTASNPNAKRRHVVYSPDRRRLLRTDDPRQAQIHDSGTLEPIGQPLRHDSAILFATFSADGTRVLTTSADRTAQVWNVETGAPIGARLHHGSDVGYASFSPDGKQVGTASDDNTARVWNAETGRSITPPLRHNATVTRIVFSPDGRCVLTTGEDGTARTWDAVTGETLTPVMKPVGWAARVLGSDDQNVGWDLPPDRRSVEHLVLLSQWLSAQRIDGTGGLVPLESEALHDRWNQLRAHYPNDLVRTSDTVVWHRQEAAAAETARDWFAAVFHLTHLIASNPSTDNQLAELYIRRGQAWAAQRHWQESADDFGAAIKAGASDEATLSAYALVLLAADDRAGYREACKNLLDQFGETAHSESAWRLVRVCMLDSQPMKEMPLVPLDAAHENDPACWIAHAATLVHQGHWDEALALLNRAQIFAESADAVRAWLLLAAVQHHLGNDADAKRWFQQSRLWIDRNCNTHPKAIGNRPPKLAWQQRLELELFLREVEQQLKVTAPVPRIEKIAN